MPMARAEVMRLGDSALKPLDRSSWPAWQAHLDACLNRTLNLSIGPRPLIGSVEQHREVMMGRVIYYLLLSRYFLASY